MDGTEITIKFHARNHDSRIKVQRMLTRLMQEMTDELARWSVWETDQYAVTKHIRRVN